MDLLGSVEKRARKALGELCARADREGWDTERLEREKSLFMLSHEVALCTAPGCLELVTAVAGFDRLDLLCEAHTGASEGEPLER